MFINSNSIRKTRSFFSKLLTNSSVFNRMGYKSLSHCYIMQPTSNRDKHGKRSVMKVDNNDIVLQNEVPEIQIFRNPSTDVRISGRSRISFLKWKGEVTS